MPSVRCDSETHGYGGMVWQFASYQGSDQKQRWSGVLFKALTPVGKGRGQWDSMLEHGRTSAYQQGTSPDGGQVRTCRVIHIVVLCVLDQHLTPQPNRGIDIELVSHPQNKLTITQQNH